MGETQAVVKKSENFLKKSCRKIWFVLVFCSTFATANGKRGDALSPGATENEFIEMIAIDKEQ